MRCKRCKFKVDENQEYCRNCGNYLLGDSNDNKRNLVYQSRKLRRKNNGKERFIMLFGSTAE